LQKKLTNGHPPIPDYAISQKPSIAGACELKVVAQGVLNIIFPNGLHRRSFCTLKAYQKDH
jgi:hypothetical protein